jgi:hypothetical protein
LNCDEALRHIATPSFARNIGLEAPRCPVEKCKWMFYEQLSSSKKVYQVVRNTMRHHTKDKGDEGLGQVIADLMTNGVHVAVPLSEHLPFDLIAIGDRGAMRRVQVRYRTSLDAAHVRCHLGTSWADRNGTHKRPFKVASIDALAIYCPSPRTFIYLVVSELPASYINLRFSKAKNGQVKRTRDASDYRDPWRMFGPLAPGSDPEATVATVAHGTPA